MIKYFLEYNDVVDVLHRVEISSDSFSGEATEVGGYAELEYMEVDDVLEAIRGSAMRIHLEASTAITFEDLYSDVERTFKVTYYRDGQIKFVGFLNPDGMYQDWVYDKWILSLDASGGLGYLENLSYPSTGIKEKEIDIIAKCLSRTGLELEICTRLITEYDTQPGGTDVLDNVYQDSERFIETDGETTMSCEEVLRGVLEKYCASIFQNNGKWYIMYLPHMTLVENNYYVYNSDGTFNRMESFGFGTRVGSEINGFYPHHCSGNQRIEMQPSIGAYRVNYKYGLIKSINDNPGFVNDGVTLTGWDIDTPDIVDLNPEGFVDISNNGTGTSAEVALSHIIGQTVFEDQEMKLKVKVQARGGASNFIGPLQAQIKATMISGDRYLTGGISNDSELRWDSDSNFVVYAGFDSENVYYEFEKTLPVLPEQAVISIQIRELAGTSPSGFLRIDYFGIGISPSDSEAEGEFHTFERITPVSSVIRDSKEIAVADSPLNIYAGALYKNDETTLTSVWQHGSKVGDIIRIMGLLTMQAFQKPAKIFKGSVFGYVDFPGGYFVESVSGAFIITDYVYNTKTNVTEIKAIEVFSNDVDSDVKYKKTIDYGNSANPTID